MSTIVAISTAPAIGGIGIIRISGEKTFEIIEKIFVPKNRKKIKEIKGNSIKYGHIVDDGKTIDEVLVSYFKAPKSYTTENIRNMFKKWSNPCGTGGIYKKSIFKWKNRFSTSRISNRYNKCKI